MQCNSDQSVLGSALFSWFECVVKATDYAIVWPLNCLSDGRDIDSHLSATGTRCLCRLSCGAIGVSADSQTVCAIGEYKRCKQYYECDSFDTNSRESNFTSIAIIAANSQSFEFYAQRNKDFFRQTMSPIHPFCPPFTPFCPPFVWQSTGYKSIAFISKHPINTIQDSNFKAN